MKTTENTNYKSHMIRIIREHQHYEEGTLESMTFEEVSEIYNRLLDWIEG